MTAKILVTGGGSGGHLNTATGVILELKERSPEMFANLVYVGGLRGMIDDPTPSLESRKVPELGVKFIGIRSGKLHRKFNLVTIKLLIGVVAGFFDAFRVVSKEKPDLIFSSGGYVTVPVVIAGWLRRIPVIIHEQTIVSGLANRISSKFARKVLVTFENSAKFFPKQKVEVTGNSLQKSRFNPYLPESIHPMYREILEDFAQSKNVRPFIFITGGGLGSHKLNMWVYDNLEYLAENYNVLLQTGENQLFKDFDNLEKRLGKLPLEIRQNVHFVKWFGEEIGFIFAQCDVVISRPGANSVLEFLAAEKRAVLVPIPWSSGNEQQLNAEYFCSLQSGKIVAENRIAEDLLPAVQDVLQKPVLHSRDSVELEASSKILDIILANLP